jgi:hypothetical protein
MVTDNDLQAKYPDLAQLFAKLNEANWAAAEQFHERHHEHDRTEHGGCLPQGQSQHHPDGRCTEATGEFAGDVDIPFNDTYAMIKTDNGWMARQ